MDRIRTNRKNPIPATLLIFFSILFLSDPGALLAANSQAASSTAADKELYAFHHGVIPGILFSENGTLFFNDLFSGTTGPFMKMAEESLGATYAAGIKIVSEHYADYDIVLMSFPEPAFEPLNYHAALVRKNGEFRYITLEKGNNIGGADVRSFFCEWKADQTHLDFGPRNYDALNAFRGELLTFLRK